MLPAAALRVLRSLPGAVSRWAGAVTAGALHGTAHRGACPHRPRVLSFLRGMFAPQFALYSTGALPSALRLPHPQHAQSFRKRRTHLALLLRERDGRPIPEGESGEALLAFPNLLPSPGLLRQVLDDLEPLLAERDGGKGRGGKPEPKKRK